MDFEVCKEGGAKGVAKDLYAFMAWLQTRGMLFGQQEALLWGCQDNTGAPWNAVQHQFEADVARVSSHYPAVCGFDFAWITETDFYQEPLRSKLKAAEKFLNTAADAHDLLLELVEHQHQQGGIVTFAWHTANPLLTAEQKNSAISLIDVFGAAGPTLPGVLLSNDAFVEPLRAKLEMIAEFAKKAEEKKIPIIFRPYHENNLSFPPRPASNLRLWWWGPGQVKGNYTYTDYKRDYKELWRRTVRFFKARQVTNFLYAYSPNVQPTREEFTNTFDATYPGDDWTDILGIDYYPQRQVIVERSYESLMDQVVAVYEQAQGKKLMAITETGLQFLRRTEAKGGPPVRDYWTMEYTLPLKHPVLGTPILVSYSMIWKNVRNDNSGEDEHYGPYPGHFSADDFRKMAVGHISRLGCLVNFRRQILFREDIKDERACFTALKVSPGAP